MAFKQRNSIQDKDWLRMQSAMQDEGPASWQMQNQDEVRPPHLSCGDSLRQADKSNSYHLMFVQDPD